MKKLITILLSALLLLALTSCNLTELLTALGEMEETGYEDEYSEDTNDYTQEDTGPKIEESKTYTIYKEIWSGPYTMKYETYVKNFQDPNNQTVSSTTTIAVDGENRYTESSGYVGDKMQTSKTIIMDGYQYGFFDEYKIIMREKARKNSGGVTAVSYTHLTLPTMAVV